MNNEQRAHDLTMLYLNKAIDSNDFSNKNDLEIDIINNYLKYYPIICEQLQSSLND